ncbi:MAG: ABC transporter permease, partial [Treponema sp.]|nr:ABC transporter permease [Treponema sp.]
MVRGALFRQKGKMLMVAFTVALGASLAAAMLNVMLDVGDKVNRELKAYGANINVLPRGASLLDDLYGVNEGSGVSDKYLAEDELVKIKMIFWTFNIVDFTPYLINRAEAVKRGGAAETPVRIAGVWFNRRLELPTGETIDTGMRNMKRWWDVSGSWLDDEDGNAAMVGEEAAKRLGLVPGDIFTARIGERSANFTVKGVFSAGEDEDDTVYVPLAAAQELADKRGLVSRVEVSALTTPDNELSRRAAQDPKSLSVKEWDTWYCTAYVSA